MTSIACSNHPGRDALCQCVPCDKALCVDCTDAVGARADRQCRGCGALVSGLVAPRPDSPVWARLPEVFGYLARPSVLMVLAGFVVVQYVLGFVPVLGGAVAFAIGASIFFRIIATSAEGADELDAPDFTDPWDDLLVPALRYLAAVVPMVAAVIWAGFEVAGIATPASAWQVVRELQGPLTLFVAGVALYPLLLAIGGLGGSILGVYNPLNWIEALRKMGGDYAAAALLFYALLLAEAFVLWPLLGTVAAKLYVPVVTPLVVGFVGLMPWVLRARLMGVLCARYLERGPARSIPSARALD